MLSESRIGFVENPQPKLCRKLNSPTPSGMEIADLEKRIKKCKFKNALSLVGDIQEKLKRTGEP